MDDRQALSVQTQIRALLLASLAAALAGCALQSTSTAAPGADLPERYSVASSPDALGDVDLNWYRGFASEELNTLVEAADKDNLDLAASSARVLQANARARAAGAALLPEFDANGNVTAYSGHSNDGSGHETDWSALLTARYELDFWGRNRALASSAQLQAAASIADHATVALTTRATVCTTYIQVLSLRERTRVAESDVKALQTVLQVLDARSNAGQADGVELATQRAAIANAQRNISQLREQGAAALGALAVLVGQKPEEFKINATSLDGLSVPQLGAGLPSRLLTRRPDLAEAEANLRAADADVRAARAELLPSLSLTVSGGLQNPAVQAGVLTLSGTGTAVTAGATLVQAIFDHGRLRSQRDLSVARKQELIAAYRAAVLASLLDVENALTARASLEEQRSSVVAATEQSQRAYDGALLRYQAGSGDYLTMLEAQRALYAAQDQASQFAAERLQAAVGLARALGGGWNPETQVKP